MFDYQITCMFLTLLLSLIAIKGHIKINDVPKIQTDSEQWYFEFDAPLKQYILHKVYSDSSKQVGNLITPHHWIEPKVRKEKVKKLSLGNVPLDEKEYLVKVPTKKLNDEELVGYFKNDINNIIQKTSSWADKLNHINRHGSYESHQEMRKQIDKELNPNTLTLELVNKIRKLEKDGLL